MKWPDDYVDRIVCGDCLDVMPIIHDKSVDLTVTSPPYDNLRTYNGHSQFDFEGISKELFRVTKLGGVVVWVVGDATINGSETGTSFRQALYFKEIGFNLHDTMIYRTNKPPMNDPRYQQSFEYMFIFSKGKPNAVTLIQEKCSKYGSKATRYQGHRDKDGAFKERGGRVTTGQFKPRENIWYFYNGRGIDDTKAFQHPARFPEALAHDHIMSWSNPGHVILDPMCGSGTTCKMAKQLNRHFIGIEINSDYCKIAEGRLRQGVLEG